MTCRLFGAPGHYLNQFWLVTNWTLQSCFTNMQNFSPKRDWKMSFATWRNFCLSRNVFRVTSALNVECRGGCWRSECRRFLTAGTALMDNWVWMGVTESGERTQMVSIRMTNGPSNLTSKMLLGISHASPTLVSLQSRIVSSKYWLIHWMRVIHTCVSKLVRPQPLYDQMLTYCKLNNLEQI